MMIKYGKGKVVKSLSSKEAQKLLDEKKKKKDEDKREIVN
jgi:hypothetical protein